ncbi:MAG: GGDEF domain-containing protein, partial [Angelakisella sp.]
EELNLQALTDRGYEYELWRMRPIDGSKQPIAISSKEVDFSDAATVSFEMPSRWTLSIVPKNGWYPKHLMLALCLGDIAVVLCFAAMLHLYHKRCELLHAKAISESVDAETGLPNRGELLRQLAEWTEHPEKPFVLIYIVIDKYNRFEQTATPEQKRELLAHMLDCMNEYIKGEHISARIGDRNFVLALREDLSPADIDNIQKGLAIEMIWKYMIDGKKFFLSVRSTARWFPSDASSPEELLTMTISDYFSQKENASEIK